MLQNFSCNLSQMAHFEDGVMLLKDSWHVARCLTRLTTLSTNYRVIIFGVGRGGWGARWGEGGWGGGKLLSDTGPCRL